MPSGKGPRTSRGKSVQGLLRWVFFSDDRSNFVRLFRIGLLPVVLTAVINAGCQHFGYYERAEWADLDRLQRTAAPVAANRVVLVLVSDRDYAEIFNQISPLDPQKVAQIVQAICRFGPRVVGVDLLTADWTLEDRERTKSFGSCPVRWIADVADVGRDADGPTGLTPVVLGKVLGESTATSAACWGLSALQPDADGVVRRYTTHQPAVIADSSNPRPVRNIALALAKGPWSASECPSDSPPEGWERRKKIPFSHGDAFRRTHAKLVLDSMDRQQQSLFETLKQGIFTDAPTVILGGAYRQARDRHRTPIGMLHGSEILANVVYTERVGREIVDVSPWISLLVDLTIGALLLAGVTWLRLRWPWALVLSASVAIGAAFLISWGLYGYYGYFLGVFGAMCGVVLGVAVEASWDTFKEWSHELWARILAISRE